MKNLVLKLTLIIAVIMAIFTINVNIHKNKLVTLDELITYTTAQAEVMPPLYCYWRFGRGGSDSERVCNIVVDNINYKCKVVLDLSYYIEQRECDVP